MGLLRMVYNWGSGKDFRGVLLVCFFVFCFVLFCFAGGGCLVVSEKTVKSGENFAVVEAFLRLDYFPIERYVCCQRS